MDSGWLQLYPLLMLVLVFCFSWLYIQRRGSFQWRPFLWIETARTHPMYIHYQVRLDRQDLYSYDKYEIWRYIERRKMFTENP